MHLSILFLFIFFFLNHCLAPASSKNQKDVFRMRI
ncbi:unnamed protein product [Amoebophrya sp. A120]|nr:unnamed protein product [Amoebophrya sp. A120]|eukprot:GSA120T00015257001.1